MKLTVALLTAGLLTSAAGANPTREQAAAFQKKLDQILLNSESPRAGARQTAVTEGEVNSYLRFSAGDKVPVGVTDPSIGIEGQGRLNGRAIVDLDVIRQKRSRGGWFDPMSYLTGRLPVTATGVLETHQGRGKFTLEAAAISGVPIPKALLQEIVSYYSRSSDFPNGINIDDPFDLPAEIRKIDVQPGRATIVQ
ncbi:MAG TPA: hypothetical protein VMO26_16650 [Vicinamibacterales bacterium]|nr:hypothetical protein [Vicinamibacterales bacterium]